MKKSICLLITLMASVGLRAGIAIDGNFADWSTIPQNILAESSIGANAKYSALYAMKFCKDKENIYFYLEYSTEIVQYTNDEGNQQTGEIVFGFNIVLSTDNNQMTGWTCTLWDNSAADYLIEIYDDNFAYGGIYQYIGEDQTSWEWNAIKETDFISLSKPVALANTHKAKDAAFRPHEARTRYRHADVALCSSDGVGETAPQGELGGKRGG